MNDEVLRAISDGMTGAVDRASLWTVQVDARRRLPVTGILYTTDLVISVDHGIEKEEDIQIRLQNGEVFVGKIAGRDALSDLAIIRLDHPARELPKIAVNEGRVGQPVFAMGLPEVEGIQASFGIITATGSGLRTMRGGVLEHFIATDTIPFPGFSGGPLVNLNGELLGINTSGLVGGSSLAIPVKLAWHIANLLAEHGRIKRGYLGIRSQKVALSPQVKAVVAGKNESGLLIVGVETDGPAEKGGMMVGDILVGINDKVVTDQDDLQALLSSETLEKSVKVLLIRGGQLVGLTFNLGLRD
jgi:S1-C subfamily serine protease